MTRDLTVEQALPGQVGEQPAQLPVRPRPQRRIQPFLAVADAGEHPLALVAGVVSQRGDGGEFRLAAELGGVRAACDEQVVEDLACRAAAVALGVDAQAGSALIAARA